MASWEDEGEFWTIRYVTHDKIVLHGSCSVRKGSILAKDLGSIHHGRLRSKSGA